MTDYIINNNYKAKTEQYRKNLKCVVARPHLNMFLVNVCIYCKNTKIKHANPSITVNALCAKK